MNLRSSICSTAEAVCSSPTSSNLTEKCRYCSRNFTKRGIVNHERRCDQNVGITSNRINYFIPDLGMITQWLILLFILNQLLGLFYWELLGPVLDKGHSYVVETTASKWTRS